MRSLPNCAVIIGAPRSGTNILRDVLAGLPGVGTWPCDEINYIWRHGNAARPDDEFRPDDATPRVQAYVRRSFERLAQRERCRSIVEKTCANSLRVGFVDRILPDAKYIWLVRDGRDAVASAMKRWAAPLNLAYIVKKAKYVPLADLPRYAVSYALNRAHRSFSTERRLASWGPRFRGVQTMLARNSLVEVCATQWSRCVANARNDLASLEPSRVLQVTYESFVAQPDSELQKLLDFLEIDAPLPMRRAATSKVTHQNVGKWQSTFDEAALLRIGAIINPHLAALGYPPICLDTPTARAA